MKIVPKNTVETASSPYETTQNTGGLKPRMPGFRYSPSRLLASIVMFFVIFGLFLSQNSIAEFQPEPVFELKSIGVMQKPIYIIKIYADGKIHYQGFSAADNGERYAQISREQLDDLELYFFSLPFEVSKKYEIKRGFERWHKTIDYKSFYSRIYMDDPIFFSVLIQKLDKLIHLHEWICFPKNHPYNDGYCVQDPMPENPDDLKNYLEH